MTGRAEFTKKERRQIGQRIKSARKAAGFPSARSFALEIEVDVSYYTLIERGERVPGYGVMRAIAEATGLKLVELLGEEQADKLASELCSKVGTDLVKELLTLPVDHLREELGTVMTRWESAQRAVKQGPVKVRAPRGV